MSWLDLLCQFSAHFPFYDFWAHYLCKQVFYLDWLQMQWYSIKIIERSQSPTVTIWNTVNNTKSTHIVLHVMSFPVLVRIVCDVSGMHNGHTLNWWTTNHFRHPLLSLWWIYCILLRTWDAIYRVGKPLKDICIPLYMSDSYLETRASWWKKYVQVLK